MNCLLHLLYGYNLSTLYQLLLAFDELYGEMDEPDKKDLLRAIIERIDLYPEKRADGCWIRNIVFTFPVPVQGVEVKELPLEKSKLVETCGFLPADHFGAHGDYDTFDFPPLMIYKNKNEIRKKALTSCQQWCILWLLTLCQHKNAENEVQI